MFLQVKQHINGLQSSLRHRSAKRTVSTTARGSISSAHNVLYRIRRPALGRMRGCVRHTANRRKVVQNGEQANHIIRSHGDARGSLTKLRDHLERQSRRFGMAGSGSDEGEYEVPFGLRSTEDGRMSARSRNAEGGGTCRAMSGCALIMASNPAMVCSATEFSTGFGRPDNRSKETYIWSRNAG